MGLKAPLVTIALGILVGASLGSAAGAWVDSTSFERAVISVGSFSGTVLAKSAVLENPGEGDVYFPTVGGEVALPKPGGTLTVYIPVRADLKADNIVGVLRFSDVIGSNGLPKADAGISPTFDVFEGNVDKDTANPVRLGDADTEVEVTDSSVVTLRITVIRPADTKSREVIENDGTATVAAKVNGINTYRKGFTFIGWQGSDGKLYDDGDANKDEASLESIILDDLSLTATWIPEG
ncbi:MAG: hypothetical protein LBU38_02590 [Propionibacteriaceae bacterium]|jgi:hypothetical protein|nr:hypothetical protein [Propionibacteriaceae bacterium]